MASKVQSLIKLTLVFIVSLLSFAVGTYVGFQFSENKHKLAVLEPKDSKSKSHASESVAAAHHEEPAGETNEGDHGATRSVASEIDQELGAKEQMSDDEIAQLAEEFVKDDAPARGTVSHGAATHGASETHGALASAKSPASVLTPPAAQLQTQPKSRIPQSLPPARSLQSPGKFTVQVSSFAGESEAKEKANMLRSEGYNSFYVPAQINGSTWYRVSIGIFQTEQEAKNLQQSYLKANANGKAFIQKIPTE